MIDRLPGQAPEVSSKWFCNSCHSLNARGAKRCYSCGAREDYLGLDELTAAPPALAKPGPEATAGRGSAGDAIAALANANGSIEFAQDGQRAPPRGRTRPKNVAALLVSALILVAVIVTAVALGIGRGPVAGAAHGSDAESTPGTAAGSPAPSAVVVASPTSSHAPKPGAIGAPASLKSSGWTTNTMDITVLVRQDGMPVRLDVDLPAARTQNEHPRSARSLVR